jgi:hypothetical protein
MSEVSICNHALSLIGVDPITALTDDTKQAGLCNRLYPILRDQVLEARTWTFATGRAKLLPDATPPEWGYAQQFLVPSDWLRTLRVYYNPPVGSNDNWVNPPEWNKEGRYILANNNVVYVKYTKQITDTSIFSPSFAVCLAYRLAADMAIPLTENRSLMNDMVSGYSVQLVSAGSIDAAQGIREEKYVGNLVTRR